MHLKRILSVAAALIAAATFGPGDVSAQNGSIQGAWVFTSEDGSNQRGLLIFTGENYSMMFVRGDEPRAEYPADRAIADEEALAAFRSITANSGRYSLEGDEVTFEAYMANDPNYMAGWPDNDVTVTIQVDGDIMTWFTSHILGLGDMVTLRRVGGP